MAIIEAIAEPAVAPAQPAGMTTEATDTQLAANQVAINRSPEERDIPLVGNQLGMLEQVVKHVRVHDRQDFKLFAELVVLDAHATRLLFGKIQPNLGRIPLQLSVLAMFDDFPTFRAERVSIAVDEVLRVSDLGRGLGVKNSLNHHGHNTNQNYGHEYDQEWKWRGRQIVVHGESPFVCDFET